MIALRVTIVLTGCLLQGAAVEDGVNPESSGELSIDRELLIRERYEEILAKNPFHESVFDKVYESYLGTESVAAWTRKLEAVEPSVENGFASLVLLARIHQRQFDSSKAVELLERASTLGADSPELRLLLGTIYYHSGNDTRAIDLLSASLDALTDPEKRARATRTLGALHLRQGNREEAVATWRRLAEQNPTDIFARLELAEILEDHRMWDEAIGAYREVVALSPDDPYRRCAGLRSIGRCHVQLEKYHDAIATYEEALELVAPGNWLFEDLKLRLVSVYEDLGELDGLAEYLKGRMDGSASDVDFSDLLAETYVRMGEVDEAEAEYRRMLERDPRRAGTYEKLIDLYSRTWQREKTIETHEKLVELFPNEPDYLRRLGEAHLRYGARDKAEEAWERLVADEPTPQRLAQLAQWFDKYGFPAEAIASYDRALADLPNRQWLFDLAELKYAEGHEEEAVALWLSSIHETDSSASECAEVASILEAHGIFDQAEVLLRKAIDEAPDDLNWQLALARNLTQQGRHSDALPYFEQLAAQAENSYFQDQGERGLIDVHAATGELEKKLQEWKELADANRDSTQVLMKCARLFAHTGDRDKTLELYQRCAELEPDNPACLRALAEVCRRARQTEQAIELYTRLLELDKPRAGAYLRELLRVYRSARMKDDAVSTAERIVELGPADPEARATLAKVYMENGDADQALQQYRRTLRLRPRDPSYLLQYGEILAGQSQWGDAKETFRRMLEAADDEQTRLTAATHLARICQQQGRLEELVEEFRTRIRHTPHKLSAYQELAAIYRQSPEPARAIEVLESGLSSVQDRRALLRELVRESYNFEDYEKVVTYYRQLLSLSGEPTVYEYERLAKVYAQMGDIDNARQMWTQIAESASDDPYVFTRLAGLMRDQGFVEESFEQTIRALELDPINHRLRLQYAEELASYGRPEEAVAQLLTLLELGDEAEKQSKEAEGEADAGGSAQPVFHHVPGGSSVLPASVQAPQSVFGRHLHGHRSYEDMRRQVMDRLGRLAADTDQFDVVHEYFDKRFQAAPSDKQAREDLLLVCERARRFDVAVEITEGLLSTHPDDIDLLQRASRYHASLGQPEEAVERLDQVLAVEPDRAKKLRVALVPLLLRSGQEARANELVDAALAEHPEDYSTIMGLATALQQAGRAERAKELLGTIQDVKPEEMQNVYQQLAQLYRNLGEFDRACALYEGLVLSEHVEQRGDGGPQPRLLTLDYGSSPSRTPERARDALHHLQSRHVFRHINHQRIEAYNNLLQIVLDDKQLAETVARIRSVAETHANARDKNQRQRAWELAQLLAAHWLVNGEYDDIIALVEHFEKAGSEDVALQNLRLYVYAQQEDYEAFRNLFARLKPNFEQQAQEIFQTETALALWTKDYDTVAENVRKMISDGAGFGGVSRIISRLDSAGQSELARQFLEDLLATPPRPPAALALLARIYTKEADHEKAIALAKERWEQRTRATPGGGARRGRGRPWDLRGSEELRLLWDCTKSAGKSSELVAEFEERAAKQPYSLDALAGLGAVYALENRRDKAVEVYEELATRLPRDPELRETLAQLYQEGGRDSDALETYMDLVRIQPSRTGNYSHNIRDLCRRLGREEELEEFTNRLLQKARTPDELQNFASQAMNEGDYDRAIELFRKAADKRPDQTWLRMQAADALKQAGRADEAIAEYARCLESMRTRSQNVDANIVNRMVGLYNVTGRLEELKADNLEALEKNPEDITARAIEACIAMFENRFEDANALFERLALSVQRAFLSPMMEMARFQGDFDAQISLTEEQAMRYGRWEYDQLANLYYQKGDHDKAMQCWEKEARRHGGPHGYSHVFNRLTDLGLWDEAAQFYRRFRTRVGVDPNAGRSMDRMAVQAFTSSGALADIVRNEILKDPSSVPSDVVNSLLNGNRSTLLARQDILKTLIENDPDNHELRLRYVHFLHNLGQREAAAAILEPLMASEKIEPEHIVRYMWAFKDLGRRDEVIDTLQTLVTSKPSSAAIKALAQALGSAGQYKALLELRDRVLDSSDVSQKEELEYYFAQSYPTICGVDWSKGVMRRRYERRRDQQSCSEYLRFLIQYAFNDETLSLLNSTEDALIRSPHGHGIRGFLQLLLGGGDLETADRVVLDACRHGERWRRENCFREATQVYAQFGRTRRLSALAAEGLWSKGRVPSWGFPLLVEVARKAGDQDAALDLCREYMRTCPFDRDAVRRTADLLNAGGRSEESIRLLEEKLPGESLRQQAQNAIELAQAYFNAGRAEEAQEIVAGLLTWANDAQTHRALGQMYMGCNKTDEAIHHFERALVSSTGREHPISELIRCYAAEGRDEEAFALWQENRHKDSLWDIHRTLLREERFLLAKRIAGEMLEANAPDARYVAPTYFDASTRAGDMSGVIAVAERALQDYPREHHHFLTRWAETLLDDGVLERTLHNGELVRSSAIRSAIVYAFASLAGGRDPDRARAIRAEVTGLEVDSPTAMLAMARALKDLEDEEAAAVWLHKLIEHPTATLHDRCEALIGLPSPGESEMAASILTEVVEQEPGWFTRPELLETSAKFGDEGLAATILERLAALSPHESHTTCCRSLYDYHAGRKDEAYASFLSIVDDPYLLSTQLIAMAEILEKERRFEDAIRVNRRLTSGGHVAYFRKDAHQRIITCALETGDLDYALHCYANALPLARGSLGEAHLLLTQKTTNEDVQGLEATIRALVGEAPGNDRASDLVGLYCELAERFGEAPSARDMAASLGLSPYEVEDAALWDRMIEDWLLIAPYDFDSNAQRGDSPPVQVLSVFDGQTTAHAWSANEAAATFMFVEGASLFPKEGPRDSRKAAYALARIQSPDQREVTFSIGANECVNVWVNGDMIFKKRGRSPACPDQERFTASLEKGENTLLVGLHANAEDPRFCLAIVEGRQGLEIAPAAPLTPAASSAETAVRRKY